MQRLGIAEGGVLFSINSQSTFYAFVIFWFEFFELHYHIAMFFFQVPKASIEGLKGRGVAKGVFLVHSLITM